jgi:hypothetical protein
MTDLGSQLREVWKQSGRQPAEGRLGSSENTRKLRRCLFFVACLALFAYVPLVWHSEPSILILIDCAKRNITIKNSIFHDYGLAEATPGFQAGWSDCMYFF